MEMKYSVVIALLAGLCATAHSQSLSEDGINKPRGEATSLAPAPDKVISRSDYIRRLQGFWLGAVIANFTGLRTEGMKKTAPFLTDEDWDTTQPIVGTDGTIKRWSKVEFVLREKGSVWNADDDTDIEYMYQHALYQNNTSILSPEEIREAWTDAIIVEWVTNANTGATSMKTWMLWVSNDRAYRLMVNGMLPPDTSNPINNGLYDMIDAQLTTEIFGLFAPSRPDVALKMAHLPIRTTAYQNAEWIAEFYVIMHSLASYVDPEMNMQEKTVWLAEQARNRLPESSYAAKIYDFVKLEYDKNCDKDNWEKTRDDLYERYQAQSSDGYTYKRFYDAGINFGASLVSLFYGQGDYKRTIQIGSLCGWDSDNPTATWGGLLGFMIGRKGVEEAFPETQLAETYKISATRQNFPDYTPDMDGEDTFELMAERGAEIIDRVVLEEMNGGVDLVKGEWTIPDPGTKYITPAEYFSR